MMRQCSYCGKEYGDEVAFCPIDRQPLGVEPPLISTPLRGSRLWSGVGIGFFCCAVFVCVFAAAVFVHVLLPFAYDGFKSARQKKALLHRSDYPQIAAACVTLAHAITNDEGMGWRSSDPFVPALLRSLSPRDIGGYSNYISLEFHGGIDHYGYNAMQSKTDPRVWSLYYYSEGGPTIFLTMITNK